MAAGIVIVGLTGGDWHTLTTPGTPVDEAKRLYRDMKVNGGKLDGETYDEVRQYTNNGLHRLRFKGNGILSFDVKLVREDDSDTADAGKGDDPVVAANKKDLQVALGVDDDAFKALWDAEGRPDKSGKGYDVAAFLAFGISQGIIQTNTADASTEESE